MADTTPPVNTAKAVEEKAPEPQKTGGKLVRTKFPIDKFVVEGIPVMTRSGVRMSAEDFKKATEAAKKSGVTLVEVSE